MAQRTDFGKQVLKKLIDMDKNTSWLADEVSKHTGLFCDSPYISRIINGERNAPKICEAIRDVLGIE